MSNRQAKKIDLLLVEDDAPKQERIRSFLLQEWPVLEIRTARSVRSAITEITRKRPDLLLLDISLPTFDVGPKESGGRPQNFGGVEILRYMDLLDVSVPTVVITAYEAFSYEGKAIDHDSLRQQLSTAHPRNYRALVYYNSLFSDWPTILSELIELEIGGRDKL